MSEKSEFYANLGVALSLDDSNFDRLLEAFNKSALEKEPKDHIKTLSSQDYGLDNEQLLAAADAGISYFESNLDFDEATEKSKTLARRVANHLNKTGTSEDLARIHNRLIAIITCFKPLARVNKIRDVMLHDETVYTSSTITPQIRPVFADDGSKIDSFVAIFNWKIGIFGRNRDEDIHLSLDLNDIDSLINSLELAREQLEIMKDQLAQGAANVITSC